MNLPSSCLSCPNLNALKAAILNEDLELTRDKLLEILHDIDGSCERKCAESQTALPLVHFSPNDDENISATP